MKLGFLVLWKGGFGVDYKSFSGDGLQIVVKFLMERLGLYFVFHVFFVAVDFDV